MMRSPKEIPKFGIALEGSEDRKKSMLHKREQVKLIYTSIYFQSLAASKVFIARGKFFKTSLASNPASPNSDFEMSPDKPCR